MSDTPQEQICELIEQQLTVLVHRLLGPALQDDRDRDDRDGSDRDGRVRTVTDLLERRNERWPK